MIIVAIAQDKSFFDVMGFPNIKKIHQIHFHT